MLINTKTKHKIEDLIDKIESGKLRLYYCSTAEIAEKDAHASFILASSLEKMDQHLFDDAINDIITVIKRFGDLVSTELIAMIMFYLIDLNEFYYYGRFCLLVDKYFTNGNFAFVPILDRPFVATAALISSKRTSDMLDAYTSVLDHNYSKLEKYIQNTGCHTFEKSIFKDNFDIYRESLEILSSL